jgi:hypothetical protein
MRTEGWKGRETDTTNLSEESRFAVLRTRLKTKDSLGECHTQKVSCHHYENKSRLDISLYAGLSVNFLLPVSDFNKNRHVSKKFSKIIKHGIHGKLTEGIYAVLCGQS